MCSCPLCPFLNREVAKWNTGCPDCWSVQLMLVPVNTVCAAPARAQPQCVASACGAGGPGGGRTVEQVRPALQAECVLHVGPGVAPAAHNPAHARPQTESRPGERGALPAPAPDQLGQQGAVRAVQLHGLLLHHPDDLDQVRHCRHPQSTQRPASVWELGARRPAREAPPAW